MICELCNITLIEIPHFLSFTETSLTELISNVRPDLRNFLHSAVCSLIAKQEGQGRIVGIRDNKRRHLAEEDYPIGKYARIYLFSLSLSLSLSYHKS